MTMKMRLFFMAMLVVGALFFLFHQDSDRKQKVDEQAIQTATQKYEKRSAQAEVITVKLQREYIDGEVSEEVKKQTIHSLEEFWTQYEQWDVVDIGKDYVIFRQKMDDISPLLKSNGYFGVTEDGVLSIFNGTPDQSKIIHTFFQIDVRKLESKIHHELKKGIPIESKKNYDQVLESFKPYSITKQ
ncbi:forespore regulator of the sigma-K checkpoint [Oikeobacillus pervagus]|uniref:Forespore regulator of the sigma-K checkpoint n=1 Tax=Oikeobacillus pervagus TaxID=1325931 RepID=A0AAJ1WG25_9BACI|nr:BofC C-terminal domain-containing protein [Oikeobacillus pervagus]MDQ0214577.1 forespore regulator of the sigma-K checkpoint [Oikeobacillus pervagus]